MKVIEISLFSGVGMFSYGFQRVNPDHQVGCFVECEAFPQRVLRHHWPDVPIYDDVRDVSYERLKEDKIIPDSAGDGRGQGNAHEEWRDEGGTSGPQCRPADGGDVVADAGSARLERHRPSEADSTIDSGRCSGNGGGELNDERAQRGTSVAWAAKQTCTQPRILISGGSPCQDLSVAGKQSGIDGDRSGLWGEFARIIGELRHLSPVVFIENVSALLTGESGAWGRRVLGDLAALGFDAEWHVVPAGNTEGRLSAGAPHRRDRVWIVAYPGYGSGRDKRAFEEGYNGPSRRAAGAGEAVRSGCKPVNVAYASSKGLAQRKVQRGNQAGTGIAPQGQAVSHMDLLAHGAAARLAGHRWLPEPGVARVTTGVPDRAAKLKALGNGLVWQIPASFYAAWLEET